MTRLFPLLSLLLALAVPAGAQDFTRITEGPLVNDDRYSEGSAWGDINNDCHLDVFVPDAFAERSNLLFLNNGDGTFTQVTEGPVVTDIGRSSGCAFGDFDNDGDLDLFVPNWEGMDSHLYLNNGDGTFTKVTSGDIVNDEGWSFNASVVDYDNDGSLDIYVDNGAFTTSPEGNFLYNGNGDGTFSKITEGEPVTDEEYSLSSSWCDFDNDGDQDLFTANSRPFAGVPLANFLYLNNGDGSFTKVTSGIVVTDIRTSTGGSWGDYDNDGDFDLFVANWDGENNQLYLNNGDGSFSRVTSGQIVNDGGSSVSGAWGDYDNDGFLDLYVANDWNENNFLYHNDGDGTFTRITVGDIVNNGGRSNGATWSDYNNDGYLDMFVPNGQDPPQSNFLYMNNGVSGNSWVNIRFVGTVSNASAVGTRVEAGAVLVDTLVWQYRELSGHQGFNAQESFNVEFGLGSAMVLDSLVIDWPSGLSETYTGLDVDEFYLAIEGEGISVVTSVEEEGIEPQPGAVLLQASPNPFGGSAMLVFELAEPGQVALSVYDLSGHLVEELFEGFAPAGPTSCLLDGDDLPQGIYLARLNANGQSAAARLVKL
jgi:hypothetical protein